MFLQINLVIYIVIENNNSKFVYILEDLHLFTFTSLKISNSTTDFYKKIIKY